MRSHRSTPGSTCMKIKVINEGEKVINEGEKDGEKDEETAEWVEFSSLRLIG